jgi:YfiH family protein
MNPPLEHPDPPVERAASLASLSRIQHGFFGRRGGESAPPFDTLNCSRSVGDDARAVAGNRAAVLSVIGAERLAVPRQVHGTKILSVTQPLPDHPRRDADGLVTSARGLALGILTADCVPVLLADPDARVIGACHAGWRGAVGGVVDRTVRAMKAIGAVPSRIEAAIGPAISAENYEVGPDWTAAFLAGDSQFSRFVSRPDGGREHFDLPEFVLDRLRHAGVVNPERVGGCTYAEPTRYFSHRYATHRRGRTGRQISLIAIER